MLVDRCQNRVGIAAVVYPEQPVADETVDFGIVNFDCEAAITGPPPSSATSHSLCGRSPCRAAGRRRAVNRVLDHCPMLLVTTLYRHYTTLY